MSLVPSTSQGGVSAGSVVLASLASSLVDDLYPWEIWLDVFTTPATQTNWPNTVDNSAGYINGACIFSSGAQNAERGYDVTLAAGTWAVDLIHTKDADVGIYTVSIDGTTVGTLDGFNAVQQKNQFASITGAVVAATGKKRLLLKMATKNAGSSSFFGEIQAIGLRRTA